MLPFIFMLNTLLALITYFLRSHNNPLIFVPFGILCVTGAFLLFYRLLHKS